MIWRPLLSLFCLLSWCHMLTSCKEVHKAEFLGKEMNISKLPQPLVAPSGLNEKQIYRGCGSLEIFVSLPRNSVIYALCTSLHEVNMRHHDNNKKGDNRYDLLCVLSVWVWCCDGSQAHIFCHITSFFPSPQNCHCRQSLSSHRKSSSSYGNR